MVKQIFGTLMHLDTHTRTHAVSLPHLYVFC